MILDESNIWVNQQETFEHRVILNINEFSQRKRTHIVIDNNIIVSYFES